MWKCKICGGEVKGEILIQLLTDISLSENKKVSCQDKRRIVNEIFEQIKNYEDDDVCCDVCFEVSNNIEDIAEWED